MDAIVSVTLYHSSLDLSVSLKSETLTSGLSITVMDYIQHVSKYNLFFEREIYNILINAYRHALVEVIYFQVIDFHLYLHVYTDVVEEPLCIKPTPTPTITTIAKETEIPETEIPVPSSTIPTPSPLLKRLKTGKFH